MSKNNADIIIPDLKVGANCFLMNISGVFEYKGMLSMALLYTNLDFLYNPDYYTVFINPRPPEDYISKDNELLIPGSLDSLYHRDYMKYIYQNTKSPDAFSINKINPGILNDYNELKNLIITKNSPVIFKGDHFYLHDDYIKKTGDIMHYHSGFHSATIVDLNNDNKTCLIIDKFFSFVGEVSLESYKNAVNSNYITKPDCSIIEVNRFQHMDEVERTRFLLKENIESSLEEYSIINDIKYYKNVKALEMFIGNYERHLIEVMEQKGKYAPQFTTKILKPVRLNKLGFSNLIIYIKDVLNIKILHEIEPLCKEITSLWTRADQLCDKCYLTGKTVIEYKDRLLDTYYIILEKEKVLFDKLEKLYVVLSNKG
ncbi:MAG: hypothetical protein WBL93_12805 [Lutisporaceae bacterium]